MGAVLLGVMLYLNNQLISQWEVRPRTLEMNFVYDDGGRAQAGFKGKTNDCVVRAAAIASGLPYAEVYAALNELCRSGRQTKRLRKSSARTGIPVKIIHPYFASLGFHWTPTMGIGSGCKVHLRADELPAGRLIVNLSRHVAAVIDGTLHDLYDCSRGGTRCVYGIWQSE